MTLQDWFCLWTAELTVQAASGLLSNGLLRRGNCLPGTAPQGPTVRLGLKTAAWARTGTSVTTLF